MSFQNFFPVWDQLQTHQQRQLLDSLAFQAVKRGTIVRGGSTDCTGLLLIRTGQLRAFVYSEEGREITIYRLFDGDMCLFCAPCVISSIQFDVTIQAEKDTEFWSIPSGVYQQLMTESAAVANYTNELMARRFSEFMNRMEQFMWKRMDKRVAAFLLQEASIEGTCELRITHETIANHLGSHREVITRTLRHFQSAGTVKLSRGVVTILDMEKLKALRT
ncbi:MAG: Crp/Fnr family transcriptional regulator [Clostridiales bacterium]|uniref:Crp/Fnr family transcriptional regulator n=1 Tax=Flavonifractor porci TaxID=3133422 RepID=UPI0030A31C61|nr:Crp/Fnr family transcriptional regulator [Clostridiales bacterium]